MSSLPEKMRAMVQGPDKQLIEQQIPLPKLEPHQVLIKVHYAAQNPTDVQSLDKNAFGEGTVFGCDFIGEVVQQGSQATKYHLGDHIAGLIWGGEILGFGAYAEYVVADQDISFRVPLGTPAPNAATIPLASLTAWLALFSTTLLNISRNGQSQPVLIWGGSSSVGQYAIQLANWQGLKVITTCSPRNNELAQKLGATHVLDYNDVDVVSKIEDLAPQLNYVFDTIGTKDSSGKAGSALKPGGKYCTVRPDKSNTEEIPEHVNITAVLVWTAFLKEHQYGDLKWPASKEDHALCKELCDNIPELCRAGVLKANDIVTLQGLDSIPKGFDMYRDGKIRAQKVVYQIDSSVE